jgi:hypothetical protein
MNDCLRCGIKEFWLKFSSTIMALLEQNDLQSIEGLFKKFLAVFFETPGTHASLTKGEHCNLNPSAFMPEGEVRACLDKTFKSALRTHRNRKIKTARRSAAAGSSSLFRFSRSRVYDICASFSGAGITRTTEALTLLAPLMNDDVSLHANGLLSSKGLVCHSIYNA